VNTAAHQPTPAEEFALGLQAYNRLSLSFGLEVPVPFVTPFIEYGFAYPLGTPQLIGPDLANVSVTDSMPQDLTIGLKVTALKDVSIVLACDIGLTRYVALGVPATSPYNLIFGISYAFDPMGHGTSKLVEKTVTVEKKVEVVKAPPVYTGKIAGQVLDSETRQPVAGVVVAMAGSGLPPVASDVDGGKFMTHELPAGKVSLTFSRDGYLPAALEASVEAGKTGDLQAFLVREEKKTPVKIVLLSNKVKAAGKVVFNGAKTAELTVPAEGATVELAKGHYLAEIDADGYLSKGQEIDVPEGGQVTMSIELALKPKLSLVVVKEDRIQIKQQVHFATGKATILNDSFQLLDQVVDAILRTNVKKMRVEGHTDNQGVKDANMKLSNDRAAAVVEYLAKKGVDKSKLVSEGYGDTKPVAPNLTAKGRELNRRVEFMILER
jgi:outer membrane protein OmpA-like peptidoglycan-associated protein